MQLSKEIIIEESNIKLVVSDSDAANTPTSKTTTSNIINMSNLLLIENSNDLDFFLFDIFGKIIQSKKIQSASESIDISNLAKGIYLYQLGEIKGKMLK